MIKAALMPGGSGPVGLDAAPREGVALSSLIETDNKLFNKVLLIFTHLCDEVSALRQHARTHVFPPLLVLAEEGPEAVPARRLEAEGAALLPMFLDLQIFVQRANALTINLLHQLASLYAGRQRLYISTFKAVRLRRAFDALGELFAIIISLDALLGASPRLAASIRAYARALQNMVPTPSQYGSSAEEVDALLSRVDGAERELCVGRLFPRLIGQRFDVAGQLAVGGNSAFMDELAEAIRHSAAHIGQASAASARHRTRPRAPSPAHPADAPADARRADRDGPARWHRRPRRSAQLSHTARDGREGGGLETLQGVGSATHHCVRRVVCGTTRERDVTRGRRRCGVSPRGCHRSRSSRTTAGGRSSI